MNDRIKKPQEGRKKKGFVVAWKKKKKKDQRPPKITIAQTCGGRRAPLSAKER